MEYYKFGPIEKIITEEVHHSMPNDRAVGRPIDINNIDIFSSKRRFSLPKIAGEKSMTNYSNDEQ